MPQSVLIRADVLDSLLTHAQCDPRIECCGVLAGHTGIITRAFPAVNVAVTPATKYEIATREIVNLMRDIRSAGLKMQGIYHSHPNGDGEPSATDIAMASYPDAAHFIISTVAPEAKMQVRAFSICEGIVSELEINVV